MFVRSASRLGLIAVVSAVASCGPFAGFRFSDMLEPADPSIYDLEITFCDINPMYLPKLPSDPTAYFDEPYIAGGTAPAESPTDPNNGSSYSIEPGEGVLLIGTFTNRDDVRRRFRAGIDVTTGRGTTMTSITDLLIPLDPGEQRQWWVQFKHVDGPYSPPVSCEVTSVDRFTADDP